MPDLRIDYRIYKRQVGGFKVAFDLDEFLTKSHQANASDIHINCNKPPMLRIHGEIYKIAGSIITAEDIKARGL